MGYDLMVHDHDGRGEEGGMRIGCEGGGRGRQESRGGAERYEGRM